MEQHYDKLKAMNTISRYDMLKDYELTFSNKFIELSKDDKLITFVFSKGLNVEFENLGCISLNTFHELYLLAEELEDCKIKTE